MKLVAKLMDRAPEEIGRKAGIPLLLAPSIRPEEEGAAPLAEDIDRQGFTIREVHLDRAYVNSPLVPAVLRAGGTVLATPWALRPPNPGLFSKADIAVRKGDQARYLGVTQESLRSPAHRRDPEP